MARKQNSRFVLKVIVKIARLLDCSRLTPKLITVFVLTFFAFPFFETYPNAWVTEHGAGQGGYVLPPNLIKQGLFFAESRIPLERPDVHERIVEQLNYLLMDRRASVTEWFNLFVLYGPIITDSLKKEQLPLDLVYLSMLLSQFDPDHKTRSGGIGWWALGPSRENSGKTGISWILASDWDDRRDPEISTKMAAEIFNGLRNKKPKDDWLFLISAFIDGSDKIDPILKNSHGFSFWDIVTPPSSDSLIPRLVALKIIHSNRKFYCVNVNQSQPLVYDGFERLRLAKDLPLTVVARWTESIPRNIWLLNPGVSPTSGYLPKADKRSPEGFPLRVPKGTQSVVKKMLQSEGYLNK